MTICKHVDCNKQACYAYHGNKAVYCATHRLEGMIYVINKHCKQDECNKIASFGFDKNKALYCKTHRVEGMVDVRSKLCVYNDCNTRSTFAFAGNKPQYCRAHHLEGMIDVKNKLCVYNDCKTQSTFAFAGNKPQYCRAHRLNGMVDVTNKHCVTDGCDIVVPKQTYQGYCLHCFMHLFPNEKIARNYKVKENEVLNFVAEKFSSCTIVRDKRIQDGCSARRPDLQIDLGFQVIIVEVDENQHQTYDCSCENKRIMQLSQDVGHRKIVFIRFNPDGYIENGVNINSCFSRNKLGFLVIPKSKKAEWEHRLNVLHDTIKYWMKYKTSKTVEIVQLFYDTM